MSGGSSASRIESQGSVQDSKNSRLSKGAIIGIAVSTVVIVALGIIVGLLILIVNRRRHTDAQKPAQTHGPLDHLFLKLSSTVWHVLLLPSLYRRRTKNSQLQRYRVRGN